ncbi:hypothetical protein L1987_36813 [Smallanthus sonchifolius]|uniref:Uncharacterized protein n=1 Tax=Smallanthus sonchifolius TaxID=185202 RepID=A0ACB9HE84_9ASTR|nr:hypothetical protein L1987_36813 [Smallanthus sonchifolius]
MAAGDDNLPRDAKTIIALLKSTGVDSFEPRIVRQFLQLYYRNAVDLLTDAKTYSNHAGKARVDYADVILAIKSKSHFSFTHPPLQEVKNAAMKVNSKPIPMAPTCGPSVPPEQDTLIASHYQIKIQSSEAVEEQEVENNVGKIRQNAPNKQIGFPKTPRQQRTNLLPGTRRRVSFPLGLNRRRFVTDAFAYVQYIMTEANFGWLIRSVHRWSASVVLAVLIASFGVTGYSLTWDQIGYWAVKIITGVLDAIPVNAFTELH